MQMGDVMPIIEGKVAEDLFTEEARINTAVPMEFYFNSGYGNASIKESERKGGMRRQLR